MAGMAQFDWADPFFLDDQLDDDERMIRDTAKAYAADKLAPRVIDAFNDEVTDPEIFREMGALGLLGPTVPPEYGGVGAGYQVSYRNGQMVVRQPPGEKNALGRIKFVFPNDYAVYMHDTPSRGLFAQSHRAFSHGCMRVDQPFALASAVLGPGSGWSEERVKKLVGPSERYINLSRPLPVHIVYFTVYVDDMGRLAQRPDLYGYSARVRKALGLGG